MNSAGGMFPRPKCRWVVVIVVVFPSADLFPGVAKRREQGLVQQLIAEPAVEGLDEVVLHGFARGDIMPFNTGLLTP